MFAATLAIFLWAPAVPGLAQTPEPEPSATVEHGAAAPADSPDFSPGSQPETAAAVSPQSADADRSAAPDGSALPHDLSPVGMFLAADIVVKAVMIALALASVITWAILLVKTLELGRAKSRLKRSVEFLAAANGLAEVKPGTKAGAAADMLAAARDEMVRSEPVLDHAPAAGVKERVSSLLTRIEVRAGKRMSAGTGILASIGSVGPFVGLFGTVWGIMNSFIGISKAQTTNLAIVAPGIAEALLATAIGLVAAIPAVVIYNYFARSVGGYKLLLADAAAAVERLVSRDLDHRHLRKAQPRRPESYAHGDTAIARIG
ncbi:MotA/TolQ/ExbB proton channel family protein [Sinorhizobium sojae CCBAU 05684]|uniref:Biopolymer transport protein ExbB n=2 Tax=Sinorhizobium sojae TaxID=716925 RepID=A0A249PA57_9HYPH|nr:MotA/TolQ/ExbB proton channel family protein [Sinorhizobium sojae CCBAU 05684]